MVDENDIYIIISKIVSCDAEKIHCNLRKQRGFYESKNLFDRFTEDIPGICDGLAVEKLNVTEVTEVRKAGRCLRRDTYFRLGGGN